MAKGRTHSPSAALVAMDSGTKIPNKDSVPGCRGTLSDISIITGSPRQCNDGVFSSLRSQDGWSPSYIVIPDLCLELIYFQQPPF